MESLVSLADVRRAAEVIAAYLPPTPIWTYPALNELTGAEVFVKHENTQPVGAFKVRGGLHLLATMPSEERARGLVTYSTGNHALSIAYACREFATPCVVVMPAAANEAKVRALRGYDCGIELQGEDLAGAQVFAETLAAERGMRMVSPGDEPALIPAVGTVALEALTAVSEVDYYVVPVGSGTGASGACAVAGELAPGCRVIAVQSDASPAAHDAWHKGEPVTRPNRTIAEGLATGRSFDWPQRNLRGRLSDFVLVADEQIGAAQRLLASHAHTLAEGAGAAALAAVLADPDRYAGRRVVVVVSGGNASASELARLAG
jgi:threonine dehydratase